MEKNDLTPEEGFTIISKAIANFKINYKENGKFFHLWGWMMSLSSFSHFIILKILISKELYNLMGVFSIGNWAAFIFSTFFIQYFMERKKSKEKKVYSHLDNFIKILWVVSGSSMFVATFISFKLGIVPPTIILLIAGVATTITGLLTKFKPLVIGGISFFVFSVATTYVTNEYTTLITGIAIICGYLVPGYLLKSAKQ